MEGFHQQRQPGAARRQAVEPSAAVLFGLLVEEQSRCGVAFSPFVVGDRQLGGADRGGLSGRLGDGQALPLQGQGLGAFALPHQRAGQAEQGGTAQL